MADETDLRCCTHRRRLHGTAGKRVKKRNPCYGSLLLFLLLTAIIFWQPAGSVRAINAALDGLQTESKAAPSRRLYSSNQFNVTQNENGVHRNSHQVPSATAKRYNASAHAVPSGPNPISN